MIDNMIQLPEKTWGSLAGLQIAACSLPTCAHGSVNPFDATTAPVTSRRRPDLS